MASMYPKVFFGNSFVEASEATLSIASSAVLYGLSVYTVFPVSVGANGELYAFRLRDHFLRLIDSAKIIGIDTFEQEWDFEHFLQAVEQLLIENDVRRDVYVRTTVHVDTEIAGTKSRGLHCVLSMFVYSAETILSQDGCRLKTSVWRRIPDYSIPSRAKVNGAYVNSVLGKQDAIDSGYDDCIFLDIQGHVCELSAANIFIVRGQKLITPDLTSDLLEGINRRSVIEIAKDAGLTVEERIVDLTELYVAEEAFASGTSANISPILEIDSRKVGNGSIGPVTRKLQEIHVAMRHGLFSSKQHWLTQVGSISDNSAQQ